MSHDRPGIDTRDLYYYFDGEQRSRQECQSHDDILSRWGKIRQRLLLIPIEQARHFLELAESMVKSTGDAAAQVPSNGDKRSGNNKVQGSTYQVPRPARPTSDKKVS